MTAFSTPGEVITIYPTVGVYETEKVVLVNFDVLGEPHQLQCTKTEALTLARDLLSAALLLPE